VPFSQEFSIDDNQRLPVPQRGAWVSVRDHFARDGASREVGIVLPVRSTIIAWIAPEHFWLMEQNVSGRFSDVERLLG
jgi:hypothetical protein